MMKTFATILILCAIAATIVAGGRAEVFADDEAEAIDHVALAALLIRDGHFDRAESVLDTVDPKQEDLDLPRYHTLKGLVFLKRGLFGDAGASFNAAIAAGQEDLVVYIYLAQAEYGLKNWRAALDALDRAGDTAANMPQLFILRASCHWQLENKTRAWQALQRGLERFPDQVDLLRQQVFYLVELKLFKQAVVLASEKLIAVSDTISDTLAISEALIKSGEAKRAIELLEALHLRQPDNPEITLALAHAWNTRGDALAAAQLFERVAIAKPQFAFETAELYRMAGRYRQALYWNAQIDDQTQKIRQRLGLLLQMENYEMAAALEARLSRLGLLQDEDIRYALAYALFKVRDFARCEQHLKFLSRSDLFNNANNLRLAMESCRVDQWECY